jgi:hypothetical protein
MVLSYSKMVECSQSKSEEAGQACSAISITGNGELHQNREISLIFMKCG